MKVFLSLFLTLFASCAHGFMVVPQARMPTTLSLLSQEETEALISQAKDCVDAECPVEDVDELISTLKGQQRELYNRVDQTKKMIKSLEIMNGKSDRQVNEVRETVRAIFRVFQLGDKASGNDFPSLSKPTGYSGETKDGSKTAWDVLPPKKWKGPEP